MIPTRDLIYLAALVILIGAFGWYTVHEQHVGAVRVEQADLKALAAAKALADAQTLAEANKALAAHKEAQNAQDAVDAYRAAHPDTPIRLCNENHSGPGVPAARPVIGGTKGAGARPPAVPAMPAGSTSPDIRPALNEIVLSAARLAIIEREFQQRSVSK